MQTEIDYYSSYRLIPSSCANLKLLSKILKAMPYTGTWGYCVLIKLRQNYALTLENKKFNWTHWMDLPLLFKQILLLFVFPSKKV